MWQSEVGREYRQYAINEYQTKVVIKRFLYTLINTSRRVITDNVINTKAILHAKSVHKGKIYTRPKKKWFEDPNGALLHVYAVSPW